MKSIISFEETRRKIENFFRKNFTHIFKDRNLMIAQGFDQSYNSPVIIGIIGGTGRSKEDVLFIVNAEINEKMVPEYLSLEFGKMAYKLGISEKIENYFKKIIP